MGGRSEWTCEKASYFSEVECEEAIREGRGRWSIEYDVVVSTSECV